MPPRLTRCTLAAQGVAAPKIADDPFCMTYAHVRQCKTSINLKTNIKVRFSSEVSMSREADGPSATSRPAKIDLSVPRADPSELAISQDFPPVKLSIVIPCYNEEKTLEACV